MINWDKLDRSSQEIFTLLAEGESIEGIEKIPGSMRAASFGETTNIDNS